MFTQKSSTRQAESDSKPVTEKDKKIEIADSLTPSVIGTGLVMVGNTYSKGQIEVSGVYQGNIKCKSLIVRSTANITGDLVAEEILVGGQVKGTIRGKNVTLQEHSNVDGDIYHKSLAVTEGAKFAGRSYQEDVQAAVSATSARSAAGSNGTSKDKAASNGATAADAVSP